MFTLCPAGFGRHVCSPISTEALLVVECVAEVKVSKQDQRVEHGMLWLRRDDSWCCSCIVKSNRERQTEASLSKFYIAKLYSS